MARSLNSRCDFENGFFTCDLPEDAILLILKVKDPDRKPHVSRGHRKAD